MSRRSAGISESGKKKIKLILLLVAVIIICGAAILTGLFGGKHVESFKYEIIGLLMVVEWLAAARPFSNEYIYFEGYDSSPVDRYIPFYNEVSYAGVAKEDSQGKLAFVLRILAILVLIVALFFVVFGYFLNGLAFDVLGAHMAYSITKYAFSVIFLYCIPLFYVISYITYTLAFKQISSVYEETIGVITERVGAESEYKGKSTIGGLMRLFPAAQWILLLIPGLRSWAIFDQVERVKTLNMLGITNTEASVAKYKRDNNLID